MAYREREGFRDSTGEGLRLDSTGERGNRDASQPDGDGPRPRRRRVLPQPVLRLLVVFAAIIIVVVVIVVAVRSAIHSGEGAEYQRYMTSVADILNSSDTQVGAPLEKLLTSPGDISRSEIQNDLDTFITKSEELEAQAKALGAPKDLVSQSVHQIFLTVMSFRRLGTTELKPALMNALEVQDTSGADLIAHALRYMTNSDFLYQEVFLPKATEILQQKGISGVTVPPTQFLSDPDITSAPNVLNIIARLRSTGNLQAVHGVAVDKVVAMPDAKEITAGGTFNLTASADLVFEVTVENQGNMEEKNVPVLVTLQAKGETQAQKVTVTIPSMKPKATATVDVKGINPTAYGVQATLKVKAGPVTDEKFLSNNLIQATLIFKL
jgi:hypothetical protein